jgi:ubiquinone/menaquinone biosynthesis C-methylase UbiE
MIVADLGPGAGHFTLRLARAVEPDGIVYALDASEKTLAELLADADERGITNLRPVRVPRDRLEVPQPVDLLFVSATYHHLPDPRRYFAEARPLLRPGGRLAVLEARRQGLLARWLAPHASPPEQLQRELADAGYRLLATHDVVPGYWYGVFDAGA